MIIKRTLPPTAAPIYCGNILKGLSSVLRAGQGVESFEAEIKEYFCVRNCFTLSSGRAALTVILRALHSLHPERMEVVIPAYTCYSVAASVVLSGCSLRLCDVDPQTLDFDYAQLESIVTGNSSKILAIVPTHLFGLPSDMERLRKMVSGHDILVVEDAAQALGGEYRGSLLGTLGDVGFFSLGRGKPITTVEGGIIITDRDDIASLIEAQIEGLEYSSAMPLVLKALALSVFINPRLYWLPKRLPFLKIGETIYDQTFYIRRLSPFQAGMARGWRGRMEYLKQARRIRATGFLSLARSSDFHIYVSDEASLPDLLRFPILSRKAGLADNFGYRGAMDTLGIVPQYPASIGSLEELRYNFNGGSYPGADHLAKHLLTLPIHPLVSKADIEKIMEFLSYL